MTCSTLAQDVNKKNHSLSSQAVTVYSTKQDLLTILVGNTPQQNFMCLIGETY